MAKGTVVRFDEIRGYGFIAPEGGGEDVFMHINDLEDDKSRFSTGTPVEFEVTEGERGLKAFDVRVVGQRNAGDGAPRAAPEGRDGHDADDALSDVLSIAEFTHELTELFLRTAPELTGAQIVALRQGLVAVARDHGWVDG